MLSVRVNTQPAFSSTDPSLYLLVLADELTARGCHTQPQKSSRQSDGSLLPRSFHLGRQRAPQVADRLGLKILSVARYDIRDARYALSLGYRLHEGGGSLQPEKWLTLRMASLQQEIQGYAARPGGTASSREFNAVQREMSRFQHMSAWADDVHRGTPAKYTQRRGRI